MSVHIITQFKTTPGRADDLLALMKTLLPSTIEHGGAEEICICQNLDDPNDIISDHRWISRQAYEDYRHWRSGNGVTARIQEMLVEPVTVRYFDEKTKAALHGDA